MINSIFITASKGDEITESNIVDWAGLTGKIVVGTEKTKSTNFSDDVKSKIFIRDTLKYSMTCPICHGYIDTNKSASYDHIIRKSEGGLGNIENGQITHPYCNQSIKN